MISLASRKNLCINEKARNAPGGDAGLNERCRELRTAPASSEKRCKFYPKIEEQTKLLEFRDHALASIRNVEDLEELGKNLNVCPYYGSRRAIKQSEVGCKICMFQYLTELDMHPPVQSSPIKTRERIHGYIFKRS